MSSRISLNAFQREAKAFWTAKPFINPDKAIMSKKSSYRRNQTDSFQFSANVKADIPKSGGYIGMKRFVNEDSRGRV